jgi:uncharacterized protein (DUF2141 family)
MAANFMKLKAENTHRFYGVFRLPALYLLAAMAASTFGSAQNCQTTGDLDDATRTAITTAGQRYFAMSSKGDTASLRQNATTTLSSDFSAVEATVKDHQTELSGGQAAVKSAFLLETEGTAPTPHAEFYCGVFGKAGQTSGSSVFVLDNLSPGKYAVVIFEVTSSKSKMSYAPVLQQVGNEWKLWWLYITSAQVAGHDDEWFAARAREYKEKGQLHNAWLFYLEARSLSSPVPFMSTQATDKLFDESQKAQPADFPANGKTVDLAAGTAVYKLTALFPQAVGDDLDLIVKYQAADASNTNQAYQSNVAVIKALVAKYPEMRDVFAGVVARAVDSSGRDYGTLLAMKDIK